MPNPFYSFRNLGVAELLENEQFISLINRSRHDRVLKAQWDAWLSEAMSGEEALQDAASVILSTSGAPVLRPQAQKDATWDRIFAGIQEPPAQAKAPVKMWWAVAASAVLILALGIALNLGNSPEKLAWQTSSTQTETIVLPDSSVVKLGPNSALQIKGDWNRNKLREVWIQGEGQFDVKHLNVDPAAIKNSERFIVHVGDEMDVEVLGTVFDVKRSASTIVVELKSGSVKIDYHDQESKKFTVLKPSEKAELNLKTGEFTRMKFAGGDAEPGQRINIQLTNTSVQEIITLIENQYQLKIDVADSSLLSRRIDGSLPLHSEKDLWFVLINILDIDIEVKSDDHLLLKSR